MFTLVTPKQTQISRPKEVEIRLQKYTNVVSSNTLLLDINQSKKSKYSQLNQKIIASNLSDNEFIANFELVNKFTDLFTDQLF